MKRFVSVLAAAMVASVCVHTTLAGQLLTNGDFENEPNFGMASLGVNQPDFSLLSGSEVPGWTIEPGHAVTMSKNPAGFVNSTYSVGTDGEGYNGNNANFYQNFSTLNSSTYNFSYDWYGTAYSTSSQLNVSIIDLTTKAIEYNGTYAHVSGLFHETATLTGTGDPFQLRIQQIPQSGTNDNGFLVDNFSVISVPEPTGLVLFTASIVAQTGLRRRRTMSRA